jgi:hypothetical protein
MTEGLRLISISYQASEYLLTERRVDIGQVSSLPVGETSEIAFERRVLSKAGIEHVAPHWTGRAADSTGIPADYRIYSSPEGTE